MDYITYVNRYNNSHDNFDFKSLDKISEFILTKEQIPAYFLYTYNVLDRRVLNIKNDNGELCYKDGIDYNELTNIDDIKITIRKRGPKQ